MLPYPELNIFNAYFHIQGHPQYFDKANGPAEEEKLKSIFNYKEFRPLSLFTVNTKDKLKVNKFFYHKRSNYNSRNTQHLLKNLC